MRLDLPTIVDLQGTNRMTPTNSSKTKQLYVNRVNRDQIYIASVGRVVIKATKFVSFIREHSGQQLIYNDGHAHKIHTSNRKPLPVSPESQFYGTRLVHCFEGDPGLYDTEESLGNNVKLVGEWHTAASRGTPLAILFPCCSAFSAATATQAYCCNAATKPPPRHSERQDPRGHNHTVVISA